MQVPQKVKTFAWRARKDGRLALSNLKKRNLDMEDQWFFCKSSQEDVTHSLISSQAIRDLWKNYLPFMQNTDTRMNLLALATYVMQKGKQVDLTIFFHINWGFWFSRNNAG